MILEARSPSCFSNRYVLKLDGQPIGEFQGRWLSEEIEVRLRNRRRLLLRKGSWLGSRLSLEDAATGETLADAERGGMFTSAWDLRLSTGSARLVSAGILTSGFRVVNGDTTIAAVDRIGLCESGWSVEGESDLQPTDLVFIGLIFSTILRRRAAASAAG